MPCRPAWVVPALRVEIQGLAGVRFGIPDMRFRIQGVGISGLGILSWKLRFEAPGEEI